MAEIPVPESKWSRLSDADKALVTETLRKAGSLGTMDEIVGSKDAPVVDAEARLAEIANADRSTACTAACGTAAAAGGAACAMLAPAAAESCMLAAIAGYEQCMEYCDQ